jgi:UDP-N-acetylglucosamine acyltransferase
MSMIDSTARISPGALIGAETLIGPFCVIGPDAVIGERCRLLAHVHVAGRTKIGARTVVYPFASLGTPPQSTKYRGGPTRLEIGFDCEIRENVTISIGTEDDGGVTEIGDHCFLMAGSHVAHDCKIGSHVSLANNVLLGGHVSVGAYTFLGGQAAVRQFVRIGGGVMVVGLSGVRADVIPYASVQGPLARLVGLNVVGLARRGFAKSDIRKLRDAYRYLFLGEGVFRDRLEQLGQTSVDSPLVSDVIAFIRAGKRALTTSTGRGGGVASGSEDA